jgi:hypothetical protein
MEVGAITGRIELDANPALRAERAAAEGAVKMKGVMEGANLSAIKNTEAMWNTYHDKAVRNWDWAGIQVLNSNRSTALNVKGTWESTMAGLKESMGKGSVFGQTMKLMMGGGAVMGLSMAGSALQRMTGELRQLTTAFREGEISAGEFAEKLAGSIPVFGEFWKAGRDIRELITGEEAAAARSGKQMTAAMEVRAAETKRLAEATKSYADEMARLNRERRLQMAAPGDKAGVEKAMGFEDRVKGYRDTYEAELAATPLPDMDVAKDALDLAELKKKLAEQIGFLDMLRGDEFGTPDNLARAQTAINETQSAISDIMVKEGQYRDAINQRTEAEKRYLDLRKQAFAIAAEDVRAEQKAASEMNAKIFSEANAPLGPPGSAFSRPDINGLFDQLAATHKGEARPLIQLPTDTVAGQELFGAHTVTAADRPAGYAEDQQNNRRTAEASEKSNDILKQIVDGLGELSQTSGPQRVDVINSGDW